LKYFHSRLKSLRKSFLNNSLPSRLRPYILTLWAYRYTPKSTTQETPYGLTYDTEVMIPIEVGEPSIRRTLFDLSLNKESVAVGLDLLNELHNKSKIREAARKLRESRRYNSKVRPRCFHQCDLVWRMRSNARKSDDKFSSNWEGSFRIREVGEGGAYHLEQLSGKIVPRTWNATHLKFYFS